MSLMGHMPKTSTQAKSWTPLGWALALTAAILFAVALNNYTTHPLPSGQSSAQNIAADSTSTMNGDDQQLIAQVAQDDPGARGAYESSLREANSYIQDAEQAARQDPDDASARELLQQAYEQKEMLYQMATARSLP